MPSIRNRPLRVGRGSLGGSFDDHRRTDDRFLGFPVQHTTLYAFDFAALFRCGFAFGQHDLLSLDRVGDVGSGEKFLQRIGQRDFRNVERRRPVDPDHLLVIEEQISALGLDFVQYGRQRYVDLFSVTVLLWACAEQTQRRHMHVKHVNRICFIIDVVVLFRLIWFLGGWKK